MEEAADILDDKTMDDDNDVFVPDTSDPKLEPLRDAIGSNIKAKTITTSSNTRPIPTVTGGKVLHKLNRVAVLFHDDGEVCPLSRGDKCSHASDDGGPDFADPFERDEYDSLREGDGDAKLVNLRKLAGCFDVAQKLGRIMSVLPNGFNGVRIPDRGISWDDGTPVDDLPPLYQGPLVPTLQQQQQNLLPPGYQQYLGVPPPIHHPSMAGYPPFAYADPLAPMPMPAQASSSSVRADSGVGESIEGTVTTTSTSYFGGHYMDALDDLEELEEGLDEGEDALAGLPGTEMKRYERKKRMGLSFLSSVSAQQLESLSPTLKSSMDNFLTQLEKAGFTVRLRHLRPDSHNTSTYTTVRYVVKMKKISMLRPHCPA